MESIWEALKKKVNEAVKKEVKEVKDWRRGDKAWHSKEWTERKRELRKELRKLRKGRLSREEFWGKRKMYEEWCEK